MCGLIPVGEKSEALSLCFTSLFIFTLLLGQEGRDAGNILTDPLLAIEEVIADSISVCVAIRLFS